MKLGEFRIEGFETQGGPALDLNLVYAIHGEPNAARDNWVFSQDFFPEELYRDMGMSSVADVIEFMKGYFGRREANDLFPG